MINLRLIQNEPSDKGVSFYSCDSNRIYHFTREPNLIPGVWNSFIERELEFFMFPEEGLLELSSKLPPELNTGFTLWESSYFYSLDTKLSDLAWTITVLEAPHSGFIKHGEPNVTSYIENPLYIVEPGKYQYRLIHSGVIGERPKELESSYRDKTEGLPPIRVPDKISINKVLHLKESISDIPSNLIGRDIECYIKDRSDWNITLNIKDIKHTPQ
jgi:hypothetical protein